LGMGFPIHGSTPHHEPGQGHTPNLGRTPQEGTMTHHPQVDDDAKRVPIHHPHSPSDLMAWREPQGLAVVVPGGPMPAELHGVRFAPSPLVMEGAEQPKDGPLFDDPLFDPMGRAPAAGAVVVEPDGRIWLVAPTNQFGGAITTFPKGKTQGLGLQDTAIKEVFEESGLRVELFSHLVDVSRSTSRCRYYLARRLGGNPADMDWETQAVLLAPLASLPGLLNLATDHQVLQALLERWAEHASWSPTFPPLNT